MKRSAKLIILLFLLVVFSLLLIDPAAAQTIVIEPGHGAGDPGAIGYTGVYEKDLNLGIASKLDQLLRDAGFQTVMTRTDDSIDCDEDADMDMANAIGADMFVSIHNNANIFWEASGSQTWYVPKSAADQAFAQSVHDRLIESIRAYPYDVYDWGLMVPDPSWGWMIARGAMPSILIEGLFVTNPTECLLLQNQFFQWTIATGIYNGITGYASPYSARYTRIDVPSVMWSNTAYQTTVKLTNNGRFTWPQGGANPVHLSYHWVNAANGQTVVFDGLRTSLASDMATSSSATMIAQVQAPSTPGTYVLKYDVVQEGVTWFSWRGSPTMDTTVTVIGKGQYDAGYTIDTPPPASMLCDQLYTSGVTITNPGPMTWTRTGQNPVRLSYHWIDRNSGQTVVGDGTRTDLPGDLAPGGSVSLTAQVRAPSVPGEFILKFDLVHEGVTWFSWQGVPTADSVSSIPDWYSADYQVSEDFDDPMRPGGTKQFTVTLTNNGSLTWRKQGPGVANAVNLSFHWYNSSGQLLAFDCVRTPLTEDVSPGQTTTVYPTITVPNVQNSTYVLKFDLVREGVTWFSWAGVPMSAQKTANISNYGATYQVSGGFSDPMPPGGQATFDVTLTNTGYITWMRQGNGPNPVNLSFHWYDSQGNLVAFDCVRTPLPEDVDPGETVVVHPTITVPNVPGSTYILKFDLVHEGRSWFSWAGVPVSASQTAHIGPTYGATYQVSGGFTDPMPPGGQATFDLTLTNTGYLTWKRSGTSPNPVNLSFHWYDSSGQLVAFDCVRTPLTEDVSPGQSVTVHPTITVPNVPGSTYILKFDLVHEGVTWFSWRGISVSSSSTANIR